MYAKKNYRFMTLLVFLILILLLVIFYVFYVHIPYKRHIADAAEIRNQIIVKHKLKYDGYFNEYDSDETYYIIKVKNKNTSTYIAYDENYKKVDEYSGKTVEDVNVIASIKNKYKVEVKSVQIGYENKSFVYYTSYQTDDHLYYFYYGLNNGKLIKAYIL